MTEGYYWILYRQERIDELVEEVKTTRQELDWKGDEAWKNGQ